MAINIDRNNGRNFAENVVNKALSFNDGTWTVSAGTGTSVLDTTEFIQGVSSLKLENTDPVNDLTATNVSQNTQLPVDGDYQISWFLKKNIALEARQVDVLIYKDAVLLDTQSCVLGSTDADIDVNNEWVRFQSDTVYTLTDKEVLTFQFVLKGAVTGELTTFVNIDGLMVNLADRGNTIVPSYQVPDRFKDLPDLPSADGNYQLTVASGVYTWTVIV